MTNSAAPHRAAPHAARAALSVVAALAALCAIACFTAATGYPCAPLDQRCSAATGALWAGAAAGAVLAVAAALRAAGRGWACALSAAALSLLPLIVLFAPLALPRRAHVVAAWFWIAVAAAGVAQTSLVMAAARARIAVIADRAAARGVSRAAHQISAAARVLAPFVVIALAARWHLMHLHHGLTLPEEGLLAHAAQVILGGGVIYRDSKSVFPPGAPYLHAGAMAAFGLTLVAGKVALSVGPVLMPLALYYVAQRMMPAGMAFAAAALAAVSAEGSAAVFLVLCGFGVGLAASGDRRANWLLAGVLTGAGAAFDAQVGLCAIAGVAVMLYLRQRGLVMRRIGVAGADLALGPWALTPFAIGLAVLWGPILLYFASRGALGALGADLAAGMRGQVFRILRPAASGLARWGPLVAYGGAASLVALRLARRRVGEGEFLALTLMGFGASAWLWSLRTRDWYHLMLGAPAAYILAAWVFGWAAKAVGQSLVGWPPWDHLRAARAGAVALAAAASALPLWHWARIAQPRLKQVVSARPLVAPPGAWRTTDRLALGGARLPPEQERVLEALAAYMERHSGPNEKIFCTPGGAALYFLLDRPDATRLDCTYAGEVGAGEAAEAAVLLHRRQVRLVVVTPGDAPWQRGLRMEQALAGYLLRNYRRVARLGDYVVLLRKGASLTPKVAPPEDVGRPPGPAPAPTMFAPRPEAQHRGRGGARRNVVD